jgi:hypothetical protein
MVKRAAKGATMAPTTTKVKGVPAAPGAAAVTGTAGQAGARAAAVAKEITRIMLGVWSNGAAVGHRSDTERRSGMVQREQSIC